MHSWVVTHGLVVAVFINSLVLEIDSFGCDLGDLATHQIGTPSGGNMTTGAHQQLTYVNYSRARFVRNMKDKLLSAKQSKTNR